MTVRHPALSTDKETDMKSILGKLVYAACFGLTLAAGGSAAQGSAASFPDKPIRLIVPFSSG